jgi:hypothetical protein
LTPYFPPEPTITRPRELTPEELALATRSTRASVAPTLSPPAEAFSGGGGGTDAGAWHTDQRVNALWVNAEERNAWVNITSIGWKQLANSSDSAVTALTIIGAQAKQSQTRVDYRDEADGMIHEMYVW